MADIVYDYHGKILIPCYLTTIIRARPGLLRRLKQNPSLLHEYDAVIRDQLAKGIIEVVDSQLSHALHLSSCSGQGRQADNKIANCIRCVSKNEWIINNDCLYAGTTFGQKILDILIRFRVHNVCWWQTSKKHF